jgi:hypothetical protein
MGSEGTPVSATAEIETPASLAVSADGVYVTGIVADRYVTRSFVARLDTILAVAWMRHLDGRAAGAASDESGAWIGGSIDAGPLSDGFVARYDVGRGGSYHRRPP